VKTAVWILFGVVAMLWTGFAFLMAGVAEWASAAAHSDAAMGAAERIANTSLSVPTPEWARGWLDPAAMKAAQDFVLSLTSSLSAMSVQALPWMGKLMEWLVPLVWTIWGAVLVMMILVTLVIQAIARRLPGWLGAANVQG
jgi:hypothetical protein